MHGRINLWPKYMLCGYLRHGELIISLYDFFKKKETLSLLLFSGSCSTGYTYMLQVLLFTVAFWILFPYPIQMYSACFLPYMKGFSFKKQHACFKTLYAFWSSLCLPRNRRAREASILQSIENGAQTLFDIVSKTYSDVDRKLWIPASFNVRLHVDHLNSLHKLPKVSTRNIIIMRYTFPLYALFKKIKTFQIFE